MVLDWLIIGLGNPGRQYHGTLHNAGFAVLDLLCQNYGLSWRPSAKMLRAEPNTACKALLVKPQTYMNRSGQILAALRRRYEFTPKNCIVLLDNLDLAPGRLRLKFGGAFSSHNGLRSLKEGGLAANFWRFFVGIGHPGNDEQVHSYVLHPPRQRDKASYTAALERAQNNLVEIIRGVQPEELLTEVNRKLPV